MAVRSCSVSPLRWGGIALRRTDDGIEGSIPAAGADGAIEWEAIMKKPTRSRSNSPPPPPREHASRLRARTVMRHRAVIPPPATPTCTPTPTPTVTPSQTPPSTTPAPTPPRKHARPEGSRGKPSSVSSSASSSGSSITFPPARLQTPWGMGRKTTAGTATEGLRVDTSLPPVPAFSSRFTPPGAAPVTAGRTAVTATAAAAAGGEGGWKKGESRQPPQPPRESDEHRAGPFAGQGMPFSGGAGVGEEKGQRAPPAAICERRGGGIGGTELRQPDGGEGLVQQDACSASDRVVASVASEVARMWDESRGTLKLSRDGFGDERVTDLSLEGLKDAYRTGRASLTSWTTAGVFNGGRKPSTDTSLVEVEQGRLGVLSSTDAYLFHFKETKPSSPSGSSPVHSFDRSEDADQGHTEVHVVYLWVGREAGTEALLAARAQGKRLLQEQSPITSRTPLLEVEQGCEPALFLALFSYMLPPLVAVVLEGQNEMPKLRVLELQESPCLDGSGIVIAVEGPSSASLLAKHGPLPDRSYICLVRPRRSRGGSASERGGTFDEGYYWHGVGETPAVEEVGILLCQQVDRMFPSPSIAECGKRKGCGRRRRGGGGGGFGGGMMRGYVADVKVGLPVPDGFWACVLPERSVSSSFFASGGRWLPLQDLRPVRRSRPVRVFGVCAGSQNARKSFVWEVTTGGMPSQMRLSPSLSHVVDAGGSHVYVWHGNGSSSDGRRLACRVASSYAAGCGAAVEEVDAGSEPVGLLDCFIGWNEALVEPPPMLSLSPGRRPLQLGTNADLSPRNTPTKTARRGRRSPTARTASSGSTSSSMGPRLTPPGQRTPPYSVNSPPSLKQPEGEACTPPRLRATPAAAAEVSSLSSQGYSTPPRNSPPVAQNAVPQCGGPSDGVNGVFASPPLRSGSTPCSDTSTPDRGMGPRGPSGEVSPTGGAGGSASDARDRSGDELPSSSSSPASLGVHPCTETGSGGKALAGFDRGKGGSCVAGFRNGQCSTGAGIQCAGGHGECGAGNDERQGARSQDGAGCGDESGGDSGGDSDRGVNDGNDDCGGRDGSGGGDGRRGGDGGAGGGGGSDDDDGDGFRGAKNDGESAAVNEEKLEEAQHRDGEESEESDADEEGDTFLRLSDVQFCEGVGITKNAGASAESSWVCSEAPDASVTGRRSGGEVETCGVLSRHLSDFFRSPFSMDSASNQQHSSIRSSSDVRTGARIVDSVRSGGPDDSGSSRAGGSGSLFGFNEENVEVSTGAIVDAYDVPASVLINYAASPRYSAPSPADVATGLIDLVGPLSLLGIVDDDDELVAKRSDCSAPAAGPADLGPAISQESRTSAAPAACEPGSIEGSKEGRQAADPEDGGDGSESIERGGDGAESEEEWLSHSISDAVAVSGSAGQSDGSEGVSLFQEENALDPNDGCRVIDSHDDNSDPFSGAPVSTKEQGEKKRQDHPAAEVGSYWAGLNEDGSWRTEYARRAAGDAGAAEAERRRLANVKADESWRSDAGKGGGTGCHAAQDGRRESRSFTRLTGNVRDKLSVFEGAPSVKAGKETTGNRSSLGALHGRGLVSAWVKKSANYASPAVATRKDCGSPSHIWSDGARRASRLADSRGRSNLAVMDDADEDGEFLWKAGPAPCRLKGRPSLNLIRNGQVRIMSKALLMSCPESGDDKVTGSVHEEMGATAKTSHAGESSRASSKDPPAPSRSPSQQQPPPRVPISPPPGRTSPVGASANRCPLPERRSPDGSVSDKRPVVPRGNFWLAKAGLTRKGATGGCAAPAPATPPRSGDEWRKGGDAFTSPLTCAIGRVAAGVATAARVNDATDGSREEGHGRPAASVKSWANLRRRLGEERKSMGGEETASPGVSSG